MRDERDELVLELVRRLQLLDLLPNQTVRSLRVVASGALLTAHSIERAEETGNPAEHEQRQERRADHDRHRLHAAPGQTLRQENAGCGQQGRCEHRDPRTGQP